MPINKKSGNFKIFLLKGFITIIEPIFSLVKKKIQLLAEKIIKIIKIHNPRPPGGSGTCASPTHGYCSCHFETNIHLGRSFMQKFLTVGHNN